MYQSIKSESLKADAQRNWTFAGRSIWWNISLEATQLWKGYCHRHLVKRERNVSDRRVLWQRMPGENQSLGPIDPSGNLKHLINVSNRHFISRHASQVKINPAIAIVDKHFA